MPLVDMYPQELVNIPVGDGPLPTRPMTKV